MKNVDSLEKNLEPVANDLKNHLNKEPIEELLSGHSPKGEKFLKDELLRLFVQISTDLDVFYTKQIQCLDELIPFYKKNWDIPADRQVSIESLEDLKLATLSLLEEHRYAFQGIIYLIEKQNGNEPNN